MAAQPDPGAVLDGQPGDRLPGPGRERRMFRYTVPVDDQTWTFDLTGDPVHVASGITLDEVDFWAEYAEGAARKARHFRVFGTGQPLPQNARWVGTCPRVSGLIWHLYELVTEEAQRG